MTESGRSHRPQHLFFIGIAGHAMRGVALAALRRGNTVSGLDENAVPPGSDWLDEHGIVWSRTPDPQHLDLVDVVIISGGLPADYPMLEEARRRHIRIISFAEYLGDLTTGKHVITVSGTHGKTTTTALITWLLDSAGRHPDYLIGIRPFNFDSSARLSGADTFVVEGDEYEASTIDGKSKVQYYHPDVLVLTSVEHDHPDIFPTFASVVDRFTEVIAGLPKTGRLIAWAANKTVAKVAAAAPCPVITYGLETGDYTPRDIAYQATGVEFDVENGPKGIMGRVAVPLYGKHNVLNVLAATAVALGEGLTMEQIIAGAANFRGAYRRFNLLTEPEATVTVVDDYAHHPTEVATTLEAAKLHFAGRRIVAVFRPHTYSRTAALLEEYRRSFDSADLVYITDIEAAREAGHNPSGVSGLDITKALSSAALYTPDRADLIRRIKLDSKPGDVVVCMSVSGHNNLAEELAQALNTSVTKESEINEEPATHEGQRLFVRR
jgi:UDP-N-acetylmuramate--alanine ligase